MGVLDEHLELANGVRIPVLGLGTWQTPNVDAPGVVEVALRAGYTHIDTAHAYRNERGVAEGLRRSGVPREAVFITTKVRADYKSYDQAKTSIAESLAALDVESVDLLLIHAPRPWSEMFTPGAPRYFEENLAVWRALEEALDRGQARAIGVSNFEIDDITNITDQATHPPVANQIRLHIGHAQAELTAYCHAHGIAIEAYSPIRTGKLLDNPEIAAVAANYGTVAQLCIRYTLQKGCISLPKSVHEKYIIENTRVDFTISDPVMATLDAIQV
jgi:diketogulonate reductase-like aldo/keto reductase